MKTHDLSMYSARELTLDEAISINGGNPWVAFAVTYIVLQVVTNPRAHWDAFVEGFEEGYESVNN